MNNRGYTMTELLVAIGLFGVMLGLIAAFVSSMISVSVQQDQRLERQRDARRAAEVIGQDLRSNALGIVVEGNRNSVTLASLTGGAGFALEPNANQRNQKTLTVRTNNTDLSGATHLLLFNGAQARLLPLDAKGARGQTQAFTARCNANIDTTGTLAAPVKLLKYTYDARTRTVNFTDGTTTTPAAWNVSDFSVQYVYSAANGRTQTTSAFRNMSYSDTAPFRLRRLILNIQVQQGARTNTSQTVVELASPAGIPITETSTC